jgi:uncharacterized protein YhaN
MRIDRLDLIRYGKFTDRSIDFPQRERDFHVIVGPNEAGKSTLRTAIFDLLYTIPKNTPLAFLHAMPDMRLGARLEHAGESLEFHRIKAMRQAQTLRDLADKPLLEGVLGPYLGTTDSAFFEQMFGLDHERLVEGGDSILSSKNEIGQVLFQAAAGIGSLGAIREALEAEADKLWAKRRSADRAYYIAADELDRAAAALKLATVRTKDWAEALARVTELEGEAEGLRKRHKLVRNRRGLLERVRRVAPHMESMVDGTTKVEALGPVADLPVGAAKTLGDAQRVIELAKSEIDQQTQLVADAEAELSLLRVDSNVRALGTEITELDELRLQYRAYPADIGHRQSEINAQRDVALNLAAELGWDASSIDGVRTQMPPAPVRAALLRSLRSYGALDQAVDAAQRAEATKRGELQATLDALAALPTDEAPTGLQAALSQAQRLGDFDATIRQRKQEVAKREAALEKALIALGAWRCEVAALTGMMAPAPDVVQAYCQEQIADDTQARATAAQAEALEQRLSLARLAVTQFQAAHDPVTRETVLAARHERELAWSAVKSSPQEVAGRAAEFEHLVETADGLADRRHDTIQEATELQSRVEQVERLQRELELVQQEAKGLVEGSAERLARWGALARSCGLPDVPFQAAGQWLNCRNAALEAWEALLDARRELQSSDEAINGARDALVSELAKVGRGGAGSRLAALMIDAQEYVSDATDAKGQRRTLDKQLSDARRDAESLAETTLKASNAMFTWSDKWKAHLSDAGLALDVDHAVVETLLSTTEKIEGAIAAMRRIKAERIDTMQADLDAHTRSAIALAERVAPELTGKASTDIALELASRLGASNEAHAETQRLTATVRAARAKLEDSTSRRNEAQATVSPLQQRAGVASLEELAGAIERSDSRRSLLASRTLAEKAIRDGSDGLTLEQLQAEAASVDMAALKGELEDLTGQDEELVNGLADLAGRRQAATTALQAIGGSADAAKAEAQRQEAIAKMADAVERYIKVYSAARLLKWSIEQYREAKQGPMLSAASAIFARLTLGSFDKLTVDFDSEPLKLLGRRPNGTVVEVAGMSEGTRDQLYLALRLAALDMHLGQAHVLPFIADDLFINYDDERAKAGLEALGELSRKTQVLFLTHHDHLLPVVREVFGAGVNLVSL